jgi:hypothetical protein
LLLAALALGGCTSAPAPEIPTATKPAAAPVPSASASPAALSDFDKALRFTRCMTEMGVKTKDPVVGEVLPVYMTLEAGEVPANFEERAQLHRTAWAKCKPLLPATWPVKEDPAQLAKERPFKDCLRRHGIEPFEADSNGMVHYPVDMSYLDDPKYKAAENACRKYYDDPANAGGS